MASCSTPLAAIRLEFLDFDPYRNTGLAAVAIRAVGEHSTAPESAGDQIRIGIVVDQVAWRGHLRAGLTARQIAARVGCRCIELQSLEREIKNSPLISMGVAFGLGLFAARMLRNH